MEHELPPRRRASASPMPRPSFVSSRVHARNSGAKTTVAVIFSSVGALLAAAGLFVAFAADPPRLVWVRFAIVSIVFMGLSVLATVAFLRTQFGAQRPAVAPDQEERLLVIADSHSNGTASKAASRARGRSAAISRSSP